MALAFSNFKRKAPAKGGWREGWVDITFDNSYPSNGEAVTAANLSLDTLYALKVPNFSEGYMAAWDEANKKIVVYEAGADGAALDEIANGGAGLDGLILRCYYEGW